MASRLEPDPTSAEPHPPSMQQLPVEHEDIFPMDGGRGAVPSVPSSSSRELPSVSHSMREDERSMASPFLLRPFHFLSSSSSSSSFLASSYVFLLLPHLGIPHEPSSSHAWVLSFKTPWYHQPVSHQGKHFNQRSEASLLNHE